LIVGANQAWEIGRERSPGRACEHLRLRLSCMKQEFKFPAWSLYTLFLQSRFSIYPDRLERALLGKNSAMNIGTSIISRPAWPAEIIPGRFCEKEN